MRFVHEDRVYVEEGNNGDEKGRLWYPDFHLRDSGVIVEYVGRPEDKEYMKGIARKHKVYREMGAQVVWLYPQDIWEETNGRYRKRPDAEHNLLNKIQAGVRAAKAGEALRSAQVDTRAFNCNYSHLRYAA